jgi:hypothetical protein
VGNPIGHGCCSHYTRAGAALLLVNAQREKRRKKLTWHVGSAGSVGVLVMVTVVVAVVVVVALWSSLS